MLRQTISATSRALRSTARLGTQRQTIAIAQSYYQTPLAVSRTRWYSSETDAAKKNGEEGKEVKEGKENGEAESPEAALKKQLEAKDAEVRDLKVSFSILTPHRVTGILIRQLLRTATSAPWPTSATSRTGHSAK
jgi:molecular chaperone GrpE